MKKIFIFLFKTIKVLVLIFAALYLNVYSSYYMCNDYILSNVEIFYLNAAMLGTTLAVYLLFSNRVKGKWKKLALFLSIYVILGFITYATQEMYIEFFLGSNVCS